VKESEATRILSARDGEVARSAPEILLEEDLCSSTRVPNTQRRLHFRPPAFGFRDDFGGRHDIYSRKNLYFGDFNYCSLDFSKRHATGLPRHGC
jgi:hypothetical protein